MPKPSFFRLNKHYQKALVDEATKVFNSKDYDRLKVKDFSEAMDLPIGTFYEYFENKEDLTTYIASIAFEKRFKALGVSNIVLFTYEDKDFSLFPEETDEIGGITYQKILNCGVGFLAKLFDEYLLDMMYPYIKEGLEKKIEEGVYKEDINIQLYSYIFTLLSSFVYHYYDKYKIDDRKEQEEVALEMVKILDSIMKK